MVFAARAPEGDTVLLGLPELRLGGLDASAAGDLLDSNVGRLDGTDPGAAGGRVAR